MRVHGSFRSDRELKLPSAMAGRPLEPIPQRPGWLQRLLGIRFDDKPLPNRDEKR